VKALRFLIPGEIQVFATIRASEGRALDRSDSRISCECRASCAGAKTRASISTTAVADGNEVVKTVAWDGMKGGVTETA